MGNRAIITTKDKRLGVYFHWNGSRDSVEAILAYCKLKCYRSPDVDASGWARFCQVAGNFFGGCYSLSIDEYAKWGNDFLKNLDNGVYIIEEWNIVGRERLCESFKEEDGKNLLDLLLEINNFQHPDEQLAVKELEEYANNMLQ